MNRFDWTDKDGHNGFVEPTTTYDEDRLNIVMYVHDGGAAEHSLDTKTARQIAAALIQAADEIDGVPVKIERWLTVDDVRQYGHKWRWHSNAWADGILDSEAYIGSDKIVMMSDDSRQYMVHDFNDGEYFTPLRWP